jgi:hypothetical protein
MPSPRGRYRVAYWLFVIFLGALCSALLPTPTAAQCARTITARVVAIDQPFFWNRLGATNPAGMIFALERDVVPEQGTTIGPGNVRLRDGKRPRPLVLRMNVGDCLQIYFTNLLDPVPANDQPATRNAGIHVEGLQLVGSIASDGSFVGKNASSLVGPGQSATYTFYAEREGAHLLYSTAANTGGEGNGGQLNTGLFGAVNVEPKGAEWYRSQVTRADLELATVGTTPAGQPIINYQAVYPPGHPFAGLPILNMLKGNEIVHSDLRAIITGPNAGRFPPGTFPPVTPAVDREQPFREFTIIYHDEIIAEQAFPEFFEDPVLSHTLHSVRDAFAFNYGTGGIGAEILANRLLVGPMHNCAECKYEEFFLTSWAVGDPAMVVDIPANARDSQGNLIIGPKATKALYPDDPSNVYHSYLRDHVKFRIVHAGSKEHHIHHQHTHQWLHTPDSDNSNYLDSQAIGPGSAFTLEMLYNGGGNRNQAVGDSIFHCHFYPHFAQGMWALWRVHDVLETGSVLDAEGRPVPGTRALPDGEIAAGTPIPAVVPLPTIAMPPLPGAQVAIVHGQAVITGDGNPGFPFFVPGVAGHRPPHPPLDTVDDGGLPRHVIVNGTFEEAHTRLDFHKTLLTADAIELPETGTPIEIAAMNFHAQREHPSYKPDGTPANFIVNGLPPAPGAPFADPCIDDFGNPAGVPRIYKAANIQIDAKLNKAGWHFPQQRILALWGDVEATRTGQRPPEPLFFRAHSGDCITYYHTNLVPHEYQLDDFQVRTPTDIMGQHIHLVKFDVLASDGAANGFNYEDGTFSPGEVLERIEAINAFGGLLPFEGGTRVQLHPEAHPFFGELGAQTTIQRWYADPLLNAQGVDRTLTTVFTHDHYGPSTHQQVGMYAGLVIEPVGSTWRHPETGEIFGGRFDGGPTSWRADILTVNPADSFREFMIEFADFQLAYEAGNVGIPDPDKAINPPGRVEVGLPFLLAPPDVCPGGVPPPCPEAISADDPGTFVVNYRNEPIPLRVRDPQTNTQAAGIAGDLSHVFRSNVLRADPAFNQQPNFYPPLTADVRPGDPFTPLLRAYAQDKIQIRILVGAHEEGHNFTVVGLKWPFEAADPNSGWRNSQMMGISEHFEFVTPLPFQNPFVPFVDYLYMPGAATDDLWNGLWGLLRVYNNLRPDLYPLPGWQGDLKVTKLRELVTATTSSSGTTTMSTTESTTDSSMTSGDTTTLSTTEQTLSTQELNAQSTILATSGESSLTTTETTSLTNFGGWGLLNCTVRVLDVTAVTAQQALPGGKLIYNPRTVNGGPLNDPTAILYVRTSDLDSTGKLKAGVPIEPLIVRANAGECVKLRLRNRLPTTLPDLDGFNTLPMIVRKFNANQVKPSPFVGLRTQLVFTDVALSAGVNAGFNPVQTVRPGYSRPYVFYTGDIQVNLDGSIQATPIEFGATNLISSDPIKHSNKGAIGGLIIEPPGSTWSESSKSRATALVTKADRTRFREFVLLFQDDINMRFGDGRPIPNTAEAEDPEDSGQKAVNYRTEPMWFRMGFAPDTPLETTRTFDFTNVLSNGKVGGDPVTPVFTAQVGESVRFRVLKPAGHARNHVFMLHGHIWEELPYINGSLLLGSNPLSEWKGAQMGHGPTNHFDVLLKNGAGGRFGIVGDYLWRDFASFTFDGGIWGLFRVTRSNVKTTSETTSDPTVIE